MTTISVAKARELFSKLIKETATKKDRYIVEMQNIPVAVVVNYQEYKEQLEELEDLRMACNPDIIADMEEAEAEYKKGKGQDFDEFAKELGI